MTDDRQAGCKKILILGCSGSGKSTLTRLISETYDIPAIHLDIYFWNPNWVETPRELWREKVKELIRGNEWVMDGTFSESLDIRFPVADQIIVLNLPRWLCLYRVIKRVFQYNKKQRRPDMALGCDEKFDLEFYKYIWTYNQRVLPKVREAIKALNCESKVIYLTSRSEVKSFVRSLLS